MSEPTKIEFRYRRIQQIEDLTDICAILFPNNRNQRYAAARILIALKDAEDLLPSLGALEAPCGLSRRILQRARGKLARLGLIEHVTWMNARHGGREGWQLSTRFAQSLRRLAEKVDRWQRDDRPDQREKDRVLVNLLKTGARDAPLLYGAAAAAPVDPDGPIRKTRFARATP